MNHSAGQSYRFQAVSNHPSHEEYKRVRVKYGNAIKWAKESHWRSFLEELTGMELWTAHRYVTNLVGDGGKARIPTLQVAGTNSLIRSVVSNEEKSEALSCLFFPVKLAESFVPPEAIYPDHVAYDFQLSVEQLRHCIAKLAPHKAPGEDGILNVVLKESIEQIAEYLLHIYKATFMLNTYSDSWRVWDTIVLQKPGKPRYDIPKA